MSDIRFKTMVSWTGTGKDGEGNIKFDDQEIRFSSPKEMGGKGVGTSPEDLLIGAVSTCYSGTLYAILSKKKLPVSVVNIHSEGIVTGYPKQTKFEKLIVHPIITGGDASIKNEYEKASLIAKEKCFIGKSIAGNIEYQVGNVQVSENMLNQETVDDLVERFYTKLTKEPYFKKMFADRNVDIEKLKERQRLFISRMANETSHEEKENQMKRVQERHSFETTPERAKIWLDTMENTVNDMQLPDEVKTKLMNRMNALMDTLIEG